MWKNVDSSSRSITLLTETNSFLFYGSSSSSVIITVWLHILTTVSTLTPGRIAEWHSKT